MGSHSHSHSKEHREHKDDKERKHRHRDDDNPDSARKSKKHRSSHHSSKKHKDDSDSDEWVEKGSSTASASSLPLPPPPVDSYGTFTPGEVKMRDAPGVGVSQSLDSLTDGYGEGEDGSSRHGGRGGGAFGIAPGEDDPFGSMGIERKRKEPKEKPDPMQTMGQSSRELNKAHWQGIPSDTPTTANRVGSPLPGSSGSGWRMSKLKRTYEMADEEGRPVEEVALERYDSLTSFHDAVEERRVLDERRGGGSGRAPLPPPRSDGRAPLPPPRPDTPSTRYVYTDTGSSGNSRPPSRGSFRRPGDAPLERTTSSTSSQASRPSTPVPSVFTPPASRTPRHPSALSQSTVLVPDPTTTQTPAQLAPPLSQSELNKLQAKVLKARLMGNNDADELEKEYERERVRTLESASLSAPPGANGDTVRMLPTLDGQGRLYDLGPGGAAQEEETQTGRRKKKEKAFESHDPKTGELIRHNADDDSLSLSELVRQERFSAGAQDQKNMDYEMATRIAGDGKFVNDLDYFDENAEKLARKKMKSDVLKKAFAVQDYARTKKALDNCTLCFGDEGEQPRSAVVALGTRAYLGLLDHEELVPGHCRIVPIQHHFSSLDADDETWDEIKNFMKTLIQMFAEQDRGVIFFESCISLKHQKHTSIEAVPVPFHLFDELPAYFQEAIDNSEQEWSQHKKRIVFTAARPFRRSLVPNLPYFMVQWDYKGEKGYGHVIEGVDDAPDRDADGDEQRGEMGEKGAGEFPRWFATEIIGGVMELEPRQWRKPRRVDFRQNEARVTKFRRDGYDKVDWTKLLQK